jgi:predicted GNAT family N-acyltransferase
MSPPLDKLEFVELGRLSFGDWARLIGGEASPFGENTARLEFRPKDHHVAIRDRHGELIAAAGATVATVAVDGHDPFEVVGYGALIVRADARGRQLSGPLMDRLRTLADRLGPDRAMLFCEPRLVRLYSRRGYREIFAPVWVDQPSGPVQMPMRAMWRPLRPVGWPSGVVRLDGLPF